MYRRRGVRYYRKKPQNVNKFQVFNKLEAQQALEGLESAHLINPLDMSNLYLRYTPVKYIFKLMSADMDQTYHFFFNFIDCVFTGIEGDANLTQKTMDLNQWFFREDIQKGYDFVVNGFQCCNMIVERYNKDGHQLSVAGYNSDFILYEDWAWSFIHVPDQEVKLSLPNYMMYGKDITDQVTGETIRVYRFWWTINLTYQMYPIETQGWHYAVFSNQNTSANGDTATYPDDHEQNRLKFQLTPGRAPEELAPEGEYTRSCHIEFLLFPKGYIKQSLDINGQPIILVETT